ncbi:MAG: hypothetical protein IJS87_02115, partial [Rhodocyclaceae bacterium]|nr:hypothetical protein [Rhodocyclaceae bacterium]
MSRKKSSSSSSRSAKGKSGGGIIVGICIGIMLGAVLAAAVAWMLSKDKPFHEPKTAPSMPVASGQQPIALPGQPGAQPIEKQDFDFYKILPNGETPKSMASVDAQGSAPPSAERFYLQVGYNDYFDIGQSGWGGAKYEPTDKVIHKKDESIDFIDDTGS